MAQAIEDSATLEAELGYFVEAGGAVPQVLASTGGGDRTQHSGTYAQHKVAIRDARPLAGSLSLDREGFVLLRQATEVADFYDRAQVEAVYEREVEALVKQATGAKRVLIFDHTLRADREEVQAARQIREPAWFVHNDYTERSAPRRLRDHLAGPEAEALLERRLAVINVWRPIRGPVKTAPLALCDARSMSPGDLVASERRSRERIGEIYLVTYNPDHRWYYVPDMAADEALLIKTYDSLEDGRARFAVHTAFRDPTVPADAPARESIETRTFAVF